MKDIVVDIIAADLALICILIGVKLPQFITSPLFIEITATQCSKEIHSILNDHPISKIGLAFSS